MRTLFLDRDGVINIEKDGSYIFSPEELAFYPGALEAIATANNKFDLIIVVTNQRGIGRGLMTETQLHTIHAKIQADLAALGGKIDAFYFAPGIDKEDPMRKPNTGMALLAKKQFPEIDFAQSVMIGNNLSDMKFGKDLGMHTIFLHTTQDKINLPHALIDAQFDGLESWIRTK